MYDENPKIQVIDRSDIFGPMQSDVRDRLTNGEALPDDIDYITQRMDAQQEVIEDYSYLNDDGTIVIPETGKLMVTLRDNNAGWKSELFLIAGEESILLFDDTREGPLDVTTEYEFMAGTEIEFQLVTYPPSEEVWTKSCYGEYAQIEYDPNLMQWLVRFEDNETESSDMDFNDAVIEVEMAADPLVDVADCFEISIDYLNPIDWTPDGYTVYYIGDRVDFNVNITITCDNPLFAEGNYVVYAIQEYYADGVCDRSWYPSPPRPADESSILAYSKGDILPNQTPLTSWDAVYFEYPQTLTLNASYQSSLAMCPGLNQTRILIVRENEEGNIELTLFENPEAGVWDPPVK